MCEKWETCPDCKKDLSQQEYDFQGCIDCGTANGFRKLLEEKQ